MSIFCAENFNEAESSSLLGKLLEDLASIETDSASTKLAWPMMASDRDNLEDISIYLHTRSLTGCTKIVIGGEEHIVPLVDQIPLQDKLLRQLAEIQDLPQLCQTDLDAWLMPSSVEQVDYFNAHAPHMTLPVPKEFNFIPPRPGPSRHFRHKLSFNPLLD